MKKTAQLDRAVLSQALFLTLTYPKSFPDPKTSKLHLSRFIKRLLRKCPEAGIIWKLEFQSRSAPHFHLLLLGVPFLAHKWVAQAWFDVCGYGEDHPEHLKAGTQVEQVHSAKQATGYVSKYLGKEVDHEIEGLGRVWGCAGKLERYASSVVVVQVGRKQVARIARTLDHLRRSHSRGKRKPRRKSFMEHSAFWFASAGDIFSVLERLLEVDIRPLNSIGASEAAPMELMEEGMKMTPVQLYLPVE